METALVEYFFCLSGDGNFHLTLNKESYYLSPDAIMLGIPQSKLQVYWPPLATGSVEFICASG